MTLPSSGSLSLSQMRNEFGLGNPVSMSQMRGRAGAPSSGSISFSTMRGRSNVSFSPPSGSYSATNVGSAEFTISCSQNATWTWSVDNPNNIATSLLSGGTGTSCLFRATSVRNAQGNTSTVVRVFTVTVTAGGVSATYRITLTSQGSIRDPNA